MLSPVRGGCFFLVVLALQVLTYEPTAGAQTVRPKTVTRIFWQDRESAKLSWADVVATSKWNLKRGWVDGFPKLDSTSTVPGQMASAGSIVAVAFQSQTGAADPTVGLVFLDSGVFEEPHGNHFHWRYSRKPSVTKKTMQDFADGRVSAAAVDRAIYVTGVSRGSFTRFDAGRLHAVSSLNKPGTGSVSESYSGVGGAAIAVVNDSVAYAAWDDRDASQSGRVDVVDLTKPGEDCVAYSFRIPGGGIRAAAAVSGMVFFAAAEGVFSVRADLKPANSAVNIDGPELMRPANSDTPLQPEAFVVERDSLIFTTGSGAEAALYIVDSSADALQVKCLPIPAMEGLRPSVPKTRLSLGRRNAFIFQGRTDAESDAQEQLVVVDLDPNRDRRFSDARIRTTRSVGASKVSGEFGRHDICFDSFGRYAVFTEPGTGILNLMALNNLKIVARFRVGGAPDNIVAVGAPEHFH